MTGMVGRFGRIFLRYGCKTLLLLLAVSVIAFILVSLSPVDPVQQYVLGAGGVSAEQRAQLEEYWGCLLYTSRSFPTIRPMLVPCPAFCFP